MSIARFFKSLPMDAYPILGVTGMGATLSGMITWHCWMHTPETTMNKRRPHQFLTHSKDEDFYSVPKYSNDGSWVLRKASGGANPNNKAMRSYYHTKTLKELNNSKFQIFRVFFSFEDSQTKWVL
jgi:hypothetical protein